MRVVSFDYFRGIAILLIVAGHSYGPWAIDSFYERVLANIISGGTSLFVFISGFFFHHIFYDNFNFRKFIEKKAKNVLTPYLILSLMGIIYYVFSLSPLPYSNDLGIAGINSWAEYIEMIGTYLWTGRTTTAYWYIPFILIIFAISPFFIQYIRLSAEYRIAIFIILLLSSMFIHRPSENLSPFHSVIYFIPIYMLGIICSIHRESVIEFTKGRSVILALIILFLSCLQALLYEGYGNFDKKEIFSYGGVDIIIVQKIAMCFFFLSVLQKYENRDIPILKLLASSSFAIFFIHPWVLMIFKESGGVLSLGFLPGMVVFAITFSMALVISFFIAYAVKLLLKRNSRYFTGW